MADGADPLTGEVLAEDNVCNKAEIVRALHCVLNELESKKSSPTRKLPENAGKPWTEEDDALLAELYAQGITNKALAERFGRTGGAITSRLKRLGLIDG